MLESLGYHPIVRTSAMAAGETSQSAPQRVALLIADQSMSGMTGDRLTQRCRQIRPDLPVILCTGSEQQMPALTLSDVSSEERDAVGPRG